jgi:uncharacterized membrane protein
MGTLTTLGYLGLFLTFYAIYVKNRSDEDKKYRPWCEINKRMSCLKAFKSDYFDRFFLPNTVWGLIYYGIIIIISYRFAHYIFYVSIPACIYTLYLMYISYFKEKNFCIICSATYLINFLLLFLGWYIELL